MRKLAMAAAAAATAVLLPIGMASPAAARTADGCIVTPEKPIIVGVDGIGQNVARYGITIKCDGNRSLWVTQDFWEQDNGKPGDVGGDDLMWGAHKYPEIKVPAGGGTYHWTADRSVRPFDAPDEWVELYQRVKFTVKSGGVSDTSEWEKSDVLTALDH